MCDARYILVAWTLLKSVTMKPRLKSYYKQYKWQQVDSHEGSTVEFVKEMIFRIVIRWLTSVQRNCSCKQEVTKRAAQRISSGLTTIKARKGREKQHRCQAHYDGAASAVIFLHTWSNYNYFVLPIFYPIGCYQIHHRALACFHKCHRFFNIIIRFTAINHIGLHSK